MLVLLVPLGICWGLVFTHGKESRLRVPLTELLLPFIGRIKPSEFILHAARFLLRINFHCHIEEILKRFEILAAQVGTLDISVGLSLEIFSLLGTHFVA